MGHKVETELCEGFSSTQPFSANAGAGAGAGALIPQRVPASGNPVFGFDFTFLSCGPPSWVLGKRFTPERHPCSLFTFCFETWSH